MADLPEANQWTPGVYQIETSDPVVGGPEGVTNLPIKQLTNRTLWLKGKIESLKTITDKVIQATERAAGIARIASQNAVKAGTVSMAINFDPLLANRIDPLAHR